MKAAATGVVLDPVPVVPVTFTESDAAKYMGMTVSFLRANRSRPSRYPIPFVKIGSRCLYLKTDIDSFLEAQRVTPKSAKR